jgi:hypothetical protein
MCHAIFWLIAGEASVAAALGKREQVLQDARRNDGGRGVVGSKKATRLLMALCGVVLAGTVPNRF